MAKEKEPKGFDVAASEEEMDVKSAEIAAALDTRGEKAKKAKAAQEEQEAQAAKAARDKKKEDAIIGARRALEAAKKAAPKPKLAEKKRTDIGDPNAEAEAKLREGGDVRAGREEAKVFEDASRTTKLVHTPLEDSRDEQYARRLKSKTMVYRGGERQKEDMAGLAERISGQLADAVIDLQDNSGVKLNVDWGQYKIEKIKNGLRLDGKLYPDLETVAQIIAADIPSGTDAAAVAINIRKPELPETGFAAGETLAEDHTYTIKRGDTMMAIARKFYGKDVNLNFALELQKASFGKVEKLKGGRVSLIRPGQVVKLPKNFLGKERL